MSEIETALKNYVDTLATANINLDEVPYKVRAGREAQKREAEASLGDVKSRYETALGKTTFGLLVLGESAEFVRQASEQADILTVDASALYTRIADRVAPAMGANQEFGVSHYGAVIQELRAIAAELNIASMPSPQWTEPVNVNGYRGLVKHVQGMVDSSAGVELLTLYVRKQILEAALAGGVAKNTVPVVVTGLASAEAAQALGSRLFQEGRQLLVEVPTDVNLEFVLETFNKVKKQIKTKKS